MLIAIDFLWVGLSIPKTFNLRCMPPPLSFCAKPKAKSQNPSSNITLADGERVDVEDVGEGQTRTLPNTLDLL